MKISKEVRDKPYEQRIIEYLMDDNNYLPGHAEVVVSIEEHIWDMVEAVYEKYNSLTAKDEWKECPACGRAIRGSDNPEHCPNCTAEDELSGMKDKIIEIIKPYTGSRYASKVAQEIEDAIEAEQDLIDAFKIDPVIREKARKNIARRAHEEYLDWTKQNPQSMMSFRVWLDRRE